MSGVRRGLTMVFIDADPVRMSGGLSLAYAAAALGRDVRLFFQGASVPLLKAGAAALEQCEDLGISLTACETGLHDANMTGDDLPAHCETAGSIAVLAMDHAAEIVIV